MRKLLASPLPVESLLLTAPHLRAPAGRRCPTSVPVYVAEQEVLDGVAGFHVHRGCLAVGGRPHRRPRARPTPAPWWCWRIWSTSTTWARWPATPPRFGADALLLSPRAADPFYRKAIRVSMGSVFTLPIVRAAALARRPRGAAAARAVAGGRRPRRGRDPAGPVHLAAAGGAGAGQRGARADGRRSACLRSPGDDPDGPRRADSLNVATAGALFLYDRGAQAPVADRRTTQIG